ncbi:MAG: PHP domain-containing protein [Acholeplasmataceae bacterium]|nr:PHP domain-containing protein [Acholeplasmataceae bacterium]
MAVDLHIHTVASGDGEFSPQAIISFAKEKELETIAITDHDSVESVEEAIYLGEKYGIEVIPACEFSSRYQDTWLHILGYFLDYKSPEISDWCAAIAKNRLDNVDAQIDKLQEAGLYIDKEAFLQDNPQPMPICYGKALFEDTRNKNNKLLEPYRDMDNRLVQFALDWLVSGQPYNVPQELPAVEDVINLIINNGGIPVLAHPAVTLGTRSDDAIDKFLSLGIQGIEASTSWHKQEEQDYYLQFCKERDVLATCGSDFHGRSKPHIAIGQVENNSNDVVEQLKRLKK